MYAPARSKNSGVAGTDFILGSGFISLNYLDSFTLDRSKSSVSSDLALILRVSSWPKKFSRALSLFPSLRSTYFDTSCLGSIELELNTMSNTLSNFTCFDPRETPLAGFYSLIWAISTPFTWFLFERCFAMHLQWANLTLLRTTL